MGAAITPDLWPDWVLAFGEGLLNPDPVIQAGLRVRFHEWRIARDQWFTDNGLQRSLLACNQELLRRSHG